MKRWHLLAAGLLAAAAAHAAPTRVSANAGEVRDLLWTTGTTVFAATQGGGAFQSTDSGGTWVHLPGLAARYVNRLAVSPLSTSRLYAATDSGLYGTTSGGTTWTRLSYDPATAVAVDPGSSGTDTLLVGVTGVGIVRVTSANTTPVFTRASAGLDSTDVIAIEFQSASTAVAGLACNHQDVTAPLKEGNYGGVFRTTNNGTSWTNINTLSASTLPSKCVRAVAVNSTTILVGTFDSIDNSGKVHSSASLGAWSQPAAGNPFVGDLFGVYSLKRDRNSTTTFWGGAAAVGVWRTTDGGANWTQHVTQGNDPDMYTGINAIETVQAAAPYPVLAAPKGLGVFASTSTTTTTAWNATTGLTADRVRSLSNHATASPSAYYMALENGSAMKSTNAGTSWTQLNAGLDNVWGFATNDRIRNAQVIAAHPSDTNVVALGVRTLGLYTLTGGTTWTRVTSFTNQFDHKPQSLVFSSAGTAYYTLFDSGAATPGGLFRGAITGLSSTGRPIYESAPGLGVAPGSYRVVVSPNNASRVFFLMYDSEPYRSTDGISFSRATVAHEGFMRVAFFDMAERPGDQNIVVGATNKGVFRSADGGANFARVSASGLAELGLSSIAYASDGRLFGGTLSGGFFCSKDDGSTWQAVALGSLPAVPVREVRFMNGQIHWLTDGGGIYKSTSATDCP